MRTVIQDRELTDELDSLSTLGRVDYCDVATIVGEVPGGPEELARAVVEYSAGELGQVFWRSIGLRLDHSLPRHIGGWRVADAGANWIVLETASWYSAINAIGRVGTDGASVALLARFDHPFARLVCPAITFFHRLRIPALLRAAVRHLDRTQ